MTALHNFIATSNDIAELRKLLKGGEDPNTLFTIGRSVRTPLHIAIFKCKKKPQDIDNILLVARELICFGADVDLADNAGQTPLHFAVRSWNYKMVELLLQANAQIDKRDKIGFAVLHYATARYKFSNLLDFDEHLEGIKLLLKYNPDVDIRSQRNETPVMFAVQKNNFRIVQELLKKKASVYVMDSSGRSVMEYGLLRSDVNLKIALELLKHAFYINNKIMISFVRRLSTGSCAEIEEAKDILKLFTFVSQHFNSHQLRRFIETCKEVNFEISKFLEFYINEIEQMRQDELSPAWSFYEIAINSIFYKTFEEHILSDVINKALEKLLKGQYPFFCNLIVSGIGSPYMNKRFAKICCNSEKTGRKFLNYDTLYSFSFYLSQLDMFNTMVAFS